MLSTRTLKLKLLNGIQPLFILVLTLVKRVKMSLVKKVFS